MHMLQKLLGEGKSLSFYWDIPVMLHACKLVQSFLIFTKQFYGSSQHPLSYSPKKNIFNKILIYFSRFVCFKQSGCNIYMIKIKNIFDSSPEAQRSGCIVDR